MFGSSEVGISAFQSGGGKWIYRQLLPQHVSGSAPNHVCIHKEVALEGHEPVQVQLESREGSVRFGKLLDFVEEVGDFVPI